MNYTSNPDHLDTGPLEAGPIEPAIAVVGLGASAGGITALKAFLDVMAPETGLAFVVVMHLNPDFETHLHELLGKHTHMPIVEVEHGIELHADHVYVIPPNCELLVGGDHLELRPTRQRHSQETVDIFFHSLAEHRAPRCVGVVMSGAGYDGTMGLLSIKRAGGLTLVQEPATAGYESMPKSAIRAGVADEVLPIEQIATHLEKFAHYLSRDNDGVSDAEELDEEYILAVCDVLGDHVQHDFSQYKRPMLSRRIRRRMMLTDFQSPGAYLQGLQEDLSEAKELFKDLLISVTAFFRDPKAFERLQDTVRELVRDSDTDALRIWVAGCATGEEAYSIAILAAEEIERANRPIEVQLFATDIDERALHVARAGVYDTSIEEQVSPARLERYFTRRDDGYKVVEDVRDMCIFSSHDLVSDPPFSRIDLMSFRNVLIYMEADLQTKVLALLHYALRPGGYLFLGPAENVSRRDKLFQVDDAKNKLFQAKALASDARPSFPVFDQLTKRRHGHDYRRGGTELSPRELGRVFQQRLLDRFGPASALVDSHGRVLYFSGRLGQFLEHSSGPVEDHIVELARSDLRRHLRATLHKARSRGEEIVAADLSIRIDDKIERVDLVISPLLPRRHSEPLWIVVFREATSSSNLLERGDANLDTTSSDEVVEQLEAELDATREHLETTIAQLETANEELKSSNEELLSMNEELQSSNEAMQTSKLQLQSVNQELETVNKELETKVHELDRAHADLKNLFESTRVPTMFLDRERRIKQFTPATKEIFRLIESDLGRPLGDIAPRVSGVDLTEEVDQVLETLTPREVRVERIEEDRARRVYLLRIHPYRTLDDVIDGAVLTFVDVTDFELTTERLRVRERQQACIAELGIEALTNHHFSDFAQPVVEAVCETLETDTCAVFRLQEQEHQLLLEAGIGWPKGAVGTACVPLAHNSLASYTLRVEGAVIADDLATESRFQPGATIRDGEMSSSLSCVIHGAKGPYGVLAVYAHERGAYTEDDANFLVAVANVISSALTRKDRIEELRASEARLREMTHALQRADELKDDFLAMLGHELRNPLAAITTSVDLLKMLAGDDTKIAKVRGILERQSGQMKRLLDGLLDVTRIERGKMRLEHEDIDLNQLVGDVLDDWRSRIEDAGLELHFRPAHQSCWINGDRTRLMQILGNLLSNAIKFTDAPGHIHVEASALDGVDGPVAQVSIKDTGAGVAAEAREQIFEPFRQAEQTIDRSDGGLGMGLPLAKGLVEAHGGRINLESDGLGKGTTFNVRLPSVEASFEVPTRHKPSLARRRILVVEDNRDAADLIETVLEQDGHSVWVSHNGEDALDAAHAFGPDVVLCDIGLPGKLDGFDVARDLRADDRFDQTMLVAMTGYGSDDMRQRSHDVGFDTHLIKPVDLQTIEAVLALGPAVAVDS